MANTITLKSSSYDGRYMELVCTQESDGSEKNSSTIHWTLSTLGGADSLYTTGPTTVVINGTTVYSKGRVAWNSYVFPATIDSVSGKITVSHDNDGSKEITVSFSTAIYVSADNVKTYSDTWTLDSIPRYAEITSYTLTAENETTVKISSSANANCDLLQYSIDGGDWEDGPYYNSTINDLTPNTTYNIKIRLKRKDSQLWTESETKSVTTYAYPYCTSSPDFILGERVTLKFYNPLKREFKFYIIGNGTQIDTEYDCDSDEYDGLASLKTTVPYLYATIPNDKKGKYKVKVVYGEHTHTRDNGNTYSINESECLPTFTTFSYYDSSPTIYLTGNDQILIKGKSELSVVIGANDIMTAKNGATPSKYVCSVDTYSDALRHSSGGANKPIGEIMSAGVKRITVRAYDSRGLFTPAYIDVMVYDYNKPVINAEVKRLNNFEAETTLTVNGSFEKLLINNIQLNEVKSVAYQYRETDGEWSTPTSLTFKINDGNFTCDPATITLDNSKSFEFKITATDMVELATLTATVDIGQAIFFISSNKKECYINGKRVLHDTIMVSEAETDLNNYLTTGLYFFGADYTPANIPAGANGWLEVIGSEDNRVKQIWYRCGTADTNDYMTYTRTYIAGTWSSWHKLATLTEDLYNERSHIADYVVETGTNGVWTYEKWASGKAVCWCTTDTMSVDYDTLWLDTAYYKSMSFDFPSDFFNVAPNKVTVDTLSGGGLLSNSIKTISKTDVSWYAINHANAVKTYSVSFIIEAKGTWK